MVYGKDVLRAQSSMVIRVLWSMSHTQFKLSTIAQDASFDVDNLNRYEFNEFIECIEFVIGKDNVSGYYVSEFSYMIAYMLEWFEDNLN